MDKDVQAMLEHFGKELSDLEKRLSKMEQQETQPDRSDPLSCPFCESESVNFYQPITGMRSISCSNCKACGPVSDTGVGEDSVIAWNRAKR